MRTTWWIAMVAAALAVACAAGDDTPSGDDDDDADAAPVVEGDVEILPDNMLDDLDDGDAAITEVGGRIGAWYTYNDESEGGEQTPDPGGDFSPTAGGPRDVGFMARTAGSGFSVWGAGMGFDINNPGDAKGTWDASAFSGIAFYARGDASIRVAVVTAAVVPEDSGGTCVPGTEEGEECNDAHGKVVSLDGTWRQYVVPFDEVAQDGWGKPASFDPATVTGVLFEIPEGASFEVAVDDVGLYE